VFNFTVGNSSDAITEACYLAGLFPATASILVQDTRTGALLGCSITDNRRLVGLRPSAHACWTVYSLPGWAALASECSSSVLALFLGWRGPSEGMALEPFTRTLVPASHSSQANDLLQLSSSNRVLAYPRLSVIQDDLRKAAEQAFPAPALAHGHLALAATDGHGRAFVLADSRAGSPASIAANTQALLQGQTPAAWGGRLLGLALRLTMEMGPQFVKREEGTFLVSFPVSSNISLLAVAPQMAFLET
jgi:hypothetical protein